jgi:peptidyl-prolyl cis-trans isomerase D
MMQQMRENTKIIMIVVAVAFVGWMAFEAIEDRTGGGMIAGALGRVNGTSVTPEAYQTTFQNLYQQAQQESGGQLSREQVRQIEEMAWEQTVDQLLIDQELRRRNIRVSNEEIRQAARLMPHPALMQNELFQTEGRFDIQKYQQFLSSPAAGDDLLLQLEQYYREMIPRTKLLRQVTAGMHVGDAELWRAYRDQTETVSVDYVQLDINRLVPGDVEVTDREVRAYYDANRAQFRRTAQATFTIASISKGAAETDEAAALERAQRVRAEIAGGADFAEVARRESADSVSARQGGDLGSFSRGQMVPAFDQAVFSLPIGQVSQPVQTQFGYHVIQVQERTGDEARARHVLIPIEPNEEAVDRLYARADSLEALAIEAGGSVERAARTTRAELQRGVNVAQGSPFVPGIGSMLEALEWAQGEAEARRSSGDADEVSPLFETEQAFYLVRVEQYSPAGEIPLAEATPQIRRQLTVDKKRERAREIGQQMVAEVRAGRTLEDVASARGLQVEAAGPFTRVGFNPAFGQANAVTGASFGTPVGRVSDVAVSTAGLYIVRPRERTEADRATWEAQREQQRAMMMYQMQQEQLARWLQSLRQQAEIEDNRAAALRRT